MKTFSQKNNFYLLYPIDNSINMSPLKVASPIKGFNSNSIEKYDLEEVVYKQGYTNEEENDFSYPF